MFLARDTLLNGSLNAAMISGETAAYGLMDLWTYGRLSLKPSDADYVFQIFQKICTISCQGHIEKLN